MCWNARESRTHSLALQHTRVRASSPTLVTLGPASSPAVGVMGEEARGGEVISPALKPYGSANQHPGPEPGLWVGPPNTPQIYELLEHVRGQTYRSWSLWHRTTGCPREVPVRALHWWCSRNQRPWARLMTLDKEHLQVKMNELKDRLWDSMGHTTASMTRAFFVWLCVLFCFFLNWSWFWGEAERAEGR